MPRLSRLTIPASIKKNQTDLGGREKLLKSNLMQFPHQDLLVNQNAFL